MSQLEPESCPRCAAAFIGDMPAGSRASYRGDICSRCSEREALYGPNPAKQIPFTEWPLSMDVLLEEERRLLRQYRSFVMRGQ